MTDISDNDLQRLLDNTLDRQEYQAIAETLNSESGREALSQQMDVVLNRLEAEDIENLNSSERADALSHINRHIRRSRWCRMLAYAASLAAMFALGCFCTGDFSFENVDEAVEYGEIVVAKGERPVHMMFQDGTHVIVNSGSSLSYPMGFGKDKRQVFLNGEAYFNVKSDSLWPFIVSIDKASICVTGTAFNARHYDTDSLTVVTLDDGRLKFDCEGKVFGLKPSQKVVYNHNNKEGRISSQGVSSNRVSLWKDNIIAFDKTPMSEVLNSINRLYDVEFDITNADVLKQTFTFTSSYVPLDSLLRDIENISYIKFRHKGDVIEVY